MIRNAREVVGAAALVCLAISQASGPAAQAQRYSGTEWAAPGGDWAHTRYSPLTQITARNVQQLGGAWVVDLAADEASKAPAMVASGRMFITANSGIVIALEPATGKRLWTYRPDAARRFSGVRGIGIGEGLLFAGLRDSNVLALRQDTGEVAWVSAHGPEIPSQGMSAAPAYGNGVVVAVVSLGDNFLRGRAIGLEAKTGKILWTFEVIPRPGEPGHETWPQGSDIWQYGGGAIWTTPSVDEELGLVYLETGNAVPQWGGELRPGDNLYNNSVVALDLKTGKKRWHFQTVHHDLWEHDLSTPLVLYDTEIGGRTRKVLMAMRTDGAPFFLDRATGEPVVPVEERPVKQDASLATSATQPFTRGAGRAGPACVDPRMIPAGFVAGCYFDPIRADMPNVLMPHMNMRQSPMAYSPRTGYLYATVCVNPIWIRREATGWAFVRPVKPPGMRQSGLMTALDARTGAVIWDKPLAYAACEGGSGATATAGDLVFHAEPDGELQAYDAKSGTVIWRFQTGQVGMPGGAGPGGGSPIVYQSGGAQQYVALTMNRTVWAFMLGGTVKPRPAPTPPPTSIEWTETIRTGVQEIELGVVRTYNIASAKKQVTWADDYALSAPRVRLVAGGTMTWKNTSTQAHTLVARDASWATPTIAPGASGSATIARPGTYEYICREHPWTIGQLTVD